MNLTSLGDLASNFMMRTRAAGLKQNMNRLTEELTSGRVTDVSARLGGDFSYLNDMERHLNRLNSFSVSASEAKFFMDSVQTASERLQTLGSNLSSDILSTLTVNLPSVLSNNSDRARIDLESAITALNANAAGRAIFGGIDTDGAPLNSADTLLSGLRSAIFGLTAPDDIRTAAESWFADPIGFRATMYGGSDTALAPIQIGDDLQVSMPVRADDDIFRDLLRNIAITVLATETNLGLSTETQRDLMRASAEEILSNQVQIINFRTSVGAIQDRIEEGIAKNETRKTSLEFVRNSIVVADPFETATRLEEVQFQLESLYAVTARTSRLSLLSFLQ